jgi:hypothetical protein
LEIFEATEGGGRFMFIENPVKVQPTSFAVLIAIA